MVHPYDIDEEFPALGTTTPTTTPKSDKAKVSKPSYASTIANDVRQSPLFSNHGSTSKTLQRDPSNNNRNKSSPSLRKDFDIERETLPLGHDNNVHRSSPQEEEEKYGLMGLLGVLQRISADQSMLALGNDLSTLGLNLNTSSSTLYSRFISPWLEVQPNEQQQQLIIIEPGFKKENSYHHVSASPPAHERMHMFSDETLFYTFYSMSKEIEQYAAAQELRKRNWKYCKELGLWITKENEMFIRQKKEEHGVFTFFDPTLWKKIKREWVIQWDMMEE